MADFGTPNIDIAKKSNEENIQSAKSWMVQTSENLNYYISSLESRIEALEKLISNMGDE